MGSGPKHWQTYWEQKHLDYRRLTLDNWRSVHREDWVLALEKSLLSLGGDIVLVAHSLGCLAVAWWAATDSPLVTSIQAAMLVAPPDIPSAPGCLPALSSVTPMPQRKLPFPSLLVASETDPYATVQAAAVMAQHWGSTLVNAGAAGHINADSGHGDWPEGERHLTNFLDAVHITGFWRRGSGGRAGIGHGTPSTRYLV
jgi:predicted alpha/beta hydrolase family esterase